MRPNELCERGVELLKHNIKVRIGMIEEEKRILTKLERELEVSKTHLVHLQEALENVEVQDRALMSKETVR